ncbi:MAG: tagaturonate reductase [Spirosomataceae bacterium]
MNTLSNQILQNTNLNKPQKEKVLQFGTGVLLRGLPDFLIDKANKQGIFDGGIVVVKSTDSGDSFAFERQNNLYTICERGIEDGEEIERTTICTAISRVLSAKSQWNDIIDFAKSDDLQIVISNTTEVGIQLIQDDISSNPPISFPGKLLAVLYERCKAFKADKSKGLIIIPTELISDNGTKLQEIVIELAHLNNLDSDFIDWLETANTFCNSLVDRIVPGKPNEVEFQKLSNQLGYRDDLMIIAEPYLLWAIEGDEKVKRILSFASVDEGVIIENNIEKYKELKLRMLNGTHTLSCALAFLSGFDTVKDAMKDESFRGFIYNLMFSDIANGIPYKIDSKVVQRFGSQVLDRFSNPTLDHKWLSISANYSQKMWMRNGATFFQYATKMGCVPKYMSIGFAAYILFMRNIRIDGNKFYGTANNEEYLINDSKAELFSKYSKNYGDNLGELVNVILKSKELWEQDLAQIDGLADSITQNLDFMIHNGVKNILNRTSIMSTVS